jgi:pyruvate formate-lyase/glycerol dehydratase family glycyl radical enzyme
MAKLKKKTPSPERLSLPELEPRVARMKQRLLGAPYEICMARALQFTRSYRETEGMDPALRNALALKATLENQRIAIYPDEHLAGSKTEKFLAGPLSVERGDFLRTLQLEMDVLHRKIRPFRISPEDKTAFYEEVLPYWSGRTLRDRKAREWESRGITRTDGRGLHRVQGWIDAVRFVRYVGPRSGRRMLGANLEGPLTLRRLRTLLAMRYELARNNPTPAVFCFDVQGHLSLGVDKVVAAGMDAIVDHARNRLRSLEKHDPGDETGRRFLEAVVVSLEAVTAYAGRFARLARAMAREADDAAEKRRLGMIARHLARVPAKRPRTFHEALQAAWFTLLAGEIQYGTHEVFAVGRLDQYLLPFFRADMRRGRLTRREAAALLQEFFLKLTANVEPIPEVGMETNGVLGNSQHCVVIGGLTPDGRDASNELSTLILEAHAGMKGAINQLSVRLHGRAPRAFARETARVFRRANGIALYNDDAIVPALLSDGLSAEDARDYCVVGCIETSGQSDTHGCPGGHELVLPAVLMLAMTRGRVPPPAPGQGAGYDGGDPASCQSFEDFTALVRRQLGRQIEILVRAVEAKDRAYRDFLPAPYVSALMDDCIQKARDMTAGGARYDFTSIDVRGFATFVDSLLAVRHAVFEAGEVGLQALIRACLDDFRGMERLRQRIIHEAPRYGCGRPQADALALDVVRWVHEEASRHRNIRGGKFRVCYYSYGNHVIDGFLLPATPDGRRRGRPTSNGISPSNLRPPEEGPAGPLRSASRFPPHQVSSGVSLNMRFHPRMLRTREGLETFASMIRTYFSMGGMHLQPNVVSTETLREAQRSPERYRDLVVKVSGYSAYFTDLGRSIQEDIIERTEFGG